jgi:adenylate cyclase
MRLSRAFLFDLQLLPLQPRQPGLIGHRAARFGREAERFRALGAGIAVLERNRIELARLEPMIAELRLQERRLSAMTAAACAIDAPDSDMHAVRIQAQQVERLADTINDEITVFVEQTALIISENQRIALRANILLIGVATLIGFTLAWLVARGLTRPLIRLQAGAQAVRAGKLDGADVPVTTRDEIGDVSQAFNAMVVDLREKERIKETFGQYVDPRVVSGLIAGSNHPSGGEKQIATIFFSDIIGFTGIGERLAPSALVALVNAYFTEMSEPIRDHAGIIDKYIGDAIMAFWAPPFADPTQQARSACLALLEQRDRLLAFRARVPDIIGLRRDVPLLDFRAGIATGEAVVGSIGPASARSFTVMGDVVNFCSRLEGAGKIYGTRMLIDQTTRDMADDAIETREIDTVVAVGKTEQVRIFELAAVAGDLAPERLKLFDRYAEGLAHFRTGDWTRAGSAFTAALALAPEDGPSRAMLGRIEAHGGVAPADWAGVWLLKSK